MSNIETEVEDRFFSFLCKQGQYMQVYHILQKMGLYPSLTHGYFYTKDPRGTFGQILLKDFISGEGIEKGCLVRSEIRFEGLSKSAIDRALFEAGVPGARK